ncbi:MFS general substrate transporter [Mollisia scopiformis]|uniref:MFS general substrate transporter n=1 Tax=Mollisia scopiformis TaxID=149040 RepID=A0A194XH09_MOLSC|nr:MFS general substrate transporter [Mollisia scopiformis]KUJ19414.1 MFS general substrate transporter [Mollisia scopiformis]
MSPSRPSSKQSSVRQFPPEKPTPTQAVEDEYEDAEKNYQPKSIKFWIIMISNYLATFLVALDRTIIATAIPKITDEFNSIEDIAWYGSAYMLAAACLFPIAGRIYQLYSTKWVFLAFLVIFEIGSALCGAAPSSVAFIVGRAIAGLGSAGIFVGGMMIILPIVPLRKRPLFTSLFGMSFGVASVAGPLLGGAFTDKLTWRWCFYINLPIGGFTIAAIVLLLHIPSPKHEKLTALAIVKKLDPIGILFFVPSMVCLILALQWGGSTYSWSSPKIIGLFVAFGVLLVLFIVVEVLTPETAMIPTRVVLNRSVAGAMLFMLLLSGGLFSIVYYLTTWFQAAKGVSAIHSGIDTLPTLLSMIILSIPNAIITQKTGYYVPSLLITPVFSATGAGLLSTLTPSSSSGKWIGYQILYGCGLATGFQTSTLAPQTVLPRADVAIGMAMMFFMQQLGGAIFLSVSQNVFSTKLVHLLSGVAGLDAEVIVNTGATDLRKVVPQSELSTVVNAYSYSLTRVFIMAAALNAIMILGALAVEWKNIKGEKVSEDQAKSGDKAEQGESKI